MQQQTRHIYSTVPSRLKKLIYVKNLIFHLEGCQRELFVFLKVILKLSKSVCFRQCCDPDPDPHGSGIFAWIRIRNSENSELDPE